jgi:hypothetical protein
MDHGMALTEVSPGRTSASKAKAAAPGRSTFQVVLFASAYQVDIWRIVQGCSCYLRALDISFPAMLDADRSSATWNNSQDL